MVSADAFWSHVAPHGQCWEWTGPRNQGGYGLVGHQLAHRLSWEVVNDEIPDGLCVLHRCDNPPCVNPDHLFLGTQGDNLRDMWTKGRGRAVGRVREVCPHGHAYTPDNVLVWADTFKRCRTCMSHRRERERDRRRARSGGDPSIRPVGPPSHGHACPTCAGIGTVRRRGLPGYARFPCDRCGGSGHLRPRHDA